MFGRAIVTVAAQQDLDPPAIPARRSLSPVSAGKVLGRKKSASSRNRSAMLGEPDTSPRFVASYRLIRPLKGRECRKRKTINVGLTIV